MSVPAALRKDHTPIRRVAIIGSGLAGLSLAIYLRGTGITADVFEKSRGPGGRLASKRVSGGSVDIGAQFFTIRDPQFYEFLLENAGEGSFAPWDGHMLYEAVPGVPEPWRDGPHYVGKPRMTAISRALSNHVGNGHWQKRVERVEGQVGALYLVDTEDQVYGPYDRVAITAPPEQSRALMAGLPEADSALAGFDMAATWAVAVRFSQPLDLSFDAMGLQDSSLGWVARDASKPERSAGEWWVLHATSEWSEAHRDDDWETVIDSLLAAFGERFSLEPIVDEALAHRWLYARPTSKEGPGYLALDSLGVGFCGDWLNGGRVEGAWDSARQLYEYWWDLLDPSSETLMS